MFGTRNILIFYGAGLMTRFLLVPVLRQVFAFWLFKPPILLVEALSWASMASPYMLVSVDGIWAWIIGVAAVVVVRFFFSCPLTLPALLMVAIITQYPSPMKRLLVKLVYFVERLTGASPLLVTIAIALRILSFDTALTIVEKQMSRETRAPMAMGALHGGLSLLARRIGSFLTR
jgi:hypothetical protein